MEEQVGEITNRQKKNSCEKQNSDVAWHSDESKVHNSYLVQELESKTHKAENTYKHFYNIRVDRPIFLFQLSFLLWVAVSDVTSTFVDKEDSMWKENQIDSSLKTK